ncbi:hypothetical protein FRC01_012881 [Tulasnella sp. 417]|nr:hypothetical protein FRC01_012881 [Tulasnella sp. 417]
MSAIVSEKIPQPPGEVLDLDPMESLLQQGRQLGRSDVTDELAGMLEVPEDAEMSGGYADIYHGTWTSPEGEKVEVAIKVFKKLIRKTKQDDENALIRQTASGLVHLHTQTPPICHGDIKPENVLINDRLEAVLSDFGLGRVLMGLGVPTGFTTSDTAPGTLRYMAGELFSEGGPRSSLKTDVYAFGGLTLAVMSEKTPFFGLSNIEVMVRVMQNRPPRSEDHPEVPSSDSLWSLMRHCWRKDPDARPAMLDVLEKVGLFGSSNSDSRIESLFQLREKIGGEEIELPGYYLSGDVEELEGELKIPDEPTLSSRYSKIYRGIWRSPTGQHVEVVIKMFKLLEPRNPRIDYLALRLRVDKVRQAASGLAHLHSQTPPIWHGNIGPDNVLINDRLEAELSDFGLDQTLAGLGTGDLIAPSPAFFLYNIQYGAPERYYTRGPQGPKSDVHAIGGLVLVAASGKAPFADLGTHSILVRLCDNQHPTVDEHPGLPPLDPLWSLLRRCWDRDPGARPTISRVVEELEDSIKRNPEPIFRRSAGDGCYDGDSDLYVGLDASEPAAIRPFNPDSAPEALPSSTGVKDYADCISLEGDRLQKVFRRLKLEAKDSMLAGRYIEAAVHIGSTLVEIAQAVNSNEVMSASLESNAKGLADLLENLKESSKWRQADDAILCVTDIQKELQCVGQQLLEWLFSGLLKGALSACDDMECTKGEEMVQDVLRKVQPLAGSDTINLLAELRKFSLNQ